MTMQSTPEPERATQDQGTQIPIQDEASDVKQEGAAQQGGAAPEAADAASDAVKEAEEVLEAQAEEAPTNDELVEKAQAEAKDWQDKYLRLHAEWDTYRRRTAEQREQERLRAGEKLVEKLLPVIDDFERTIDYAEKNGEAGLIDGVKAVHSKFVNVLETGGVQVINSGLLQNAGRSAHGDHRRDQEGVPQTSAQIPPRCGWQRGQVQGDQRSLRGLVRR